MTDETYKLKASQNNVCDYEYAKSTKLWLDSVWRIGTSTKSIANLKALVKVSPVLTQVNLCSAWTGYGDSA